MLVRRWFGDAAARAHQAPLSAEDWKVTYQTAALTRPINDAITKLQDRDIFIGQHVSILLEAEARAHRCPRRSPAQYFGH